MYRFGVEIEILSLDKDEFKKVFLYPLTDCQILDFNECACEGKELPNGKKYHIEGCVGCGADMGEYFHLIRDYGEPPLIELVTPVLEGDEGFRVLHHTCDCLQRAGARADSTCGLHIHIDASGMTINQIVSILREYQRLESYIDLRVHTDRRGNQCKFARTLKGKDYEHITSLDELLSIMPEKNYKVNVKSLRKYGTIEFRQHQGTINFEEIRSWIIFIMLLCKRKDPIWGR